MSQTAVYDACVLYPASLRSFLMWLGVHELVRPRWSEQILDECFDNLLENRPDLDSAALARTRTLMSEAIPDSLVTGFECRIDNLSLPDPDDVHVLAAAIEVDADRIVTFNLDDFPTDQLEPFGLEAVHPDDFVHPLIDTSPRRVLLCLRDEAAIRKNPDRSIHDVLDSLRDRGLRKSSDTMRELVEGTS